MPTLLKTVCNGNNHTELSLNQALFYCSVISCTYVGSLYMLVPSRIRRLHRNDPNQIRWRSLSSLVVSIIVAVSYRPLFCDRSNTYFIPFLSYDGASTYSNFMAIGGVIFHTTILYFGEFVKDAVGVIIYLQKREKKISFSRFVQEIYLIYVTPIYQMIVSSDTSLQWTLLRNLVVAPITEEMVFRMCMVPALCASGLTVKYICCIAPLFFGFAHIHHAIIKLRQGYNFIPVILSTLFQFTYTSIFGAYASYTFLRTGSLVATIFCHSICNAMGLPNLSYLQRNSECYHYRWVLNFSHVLGVLGFIGGLLLLNLPPSLYEY